MSEEIKKIENTEILEEENTKEPAQEEAVQAESASVEIVAEATETTEAEAEHAEEAPKGRFRRSRLFALLVALCVLATISAGTMAYFRVEDTSFNVITTNGISMELVETRITDKGEVIPFPEKEGVQGMMPGVAESKIVAAKNTSDTEPIFVRIKLIPKIVAKDKTTELDVTNVVIHTDEEFWMEKDGFYYYKNPLPAGSTTEPLLDTVTVKGEVGNEYMEAEVTVSVKAYAVQVKNNDKNEETGVTGVMAAVGWPEE